MFDLTVHVLQKIDCVHVVNNLVDMCAQLEYIKGKQTWLI